MGRVRITLPEQFHFEVDLAIRISDLNYGAHLGHDALLTLLHDARVRFLSSMGFSELDIEGTGIILGDAVLVYKSEVFYPDTLHVQIAVENIAATSCDLVYLVRSQRSGKDVAHAKTGVIFFDYERRKVVPIPEGFRLRFNDSHPQ